MKLTPSLGQFEQLILMAVRAQGDQAYGSQVFSKVCELADKQMNLGSMYVTLDRLETKGYLKSKIEKGTSERGFKPRKFYRLEPAGEQALQESVETAARISQAFDQSWSLGKWKAKRAK